MVPGHVSLNSYFGLLGTIIIIIVIITIMPLIFRHCAKCLKVSTS